MLLIVLLNEFKGLKPQTDSTAVAAKVINFQRIPEERISCKLYFKPHPIKTNPASALRQMLNPAAVESERVSEQVEQQ